MKTRRDYTNASGYICPTETTAIYNADRGIKDSYTAPMIRPKVERLKQTPPPPKPKDENLQKAKRMYCDYCNSLMDFIMVHTYIVCRDFKAPAGVYDENCEALETAGARYCDETEE